MSTVEDFNIFKTIQISKYNNEKQNSVPSNSPEMDMIVDLIEVYWGDLSATGYLDNKNSEEKERIFYSVDIIFPYSHIPEQWLDGIIYIDFASYQDAV